MPQLTNKNMVVIGGSGGVDRRIVEAGIRDGARVLAVARQEAPLRRLVQERAVRPRSGWKSKANGRHEPGHDDPNKSHPTRKLQAI
jgi:NAD(P)-dependent dehydrogenase (short-subunit alcohol dehydrogenase family)